MGVRGEVVGCAWQLVERWVRANVRAFACTHEMLQSGPSTRAACPGSLGLTLSSLQLQSSSALECGYSSHVPTSPSQELTLLLPIQGTTTNHMNIHTYIHVCTVYTHNATQYTIPYVQDDTERAT